MSTLSNYALRLQTSIMDELRTVVEEEDTTLNQFINVAVAEKLATLRTERYFQERAARANRADFMAILERAGTDAIEGDELPRQRSRAGCSNLRSSAWYAHLDGELNGMPNWAWIERREHAQAVR